MGKIIAAGSSNGAATLVRYNANGSLDTTFGNGGIVTTSVGSANSGFAGVGVEADGDIVCSGWSVNGSVTVATLVAYTGSGSLDTSFGSDGHCPNTAERGRWHACVAT